MSLVSPFGTALRRGASAVRVQRTNYATVAKVLKDTYKDSIELMRISNKLKSTPGVTDAACMLGTEANIELMKNAGLVKDSDVKGIGLTDLIISVSAADDAVIQETIKNVVTELTSSSSSFGGGGGEAEQMKPKTWEEGLLMMKDANFALISAPGNYATAEALKALKKGLHVFMFSDNVSVEDERMLKDYAKKKGLFVMGPDCGTAIIDDVPFAFANSVRRGPIGLVSSSGTGSQQISCLIDKFGSGVSQMFGTGGRDLKEPVTGITTLMGFEALEKDPNTLVITVVSKGTPGPTAHAALCEKIKKCKKPVVVVLLGADGAQLAAAGARVARTLEDAAVLSIQALKGITTGVVADPNAVPQKKNSNHGFKPEQKKIYGLFAGGTHAHETELVFKDLKAVQGLGEFEEEVIDLGDDQYCVGKPHPMIDGSTRNAVLKKTAAYPDCGVIIFDVVLGYGSHANPAADISAAIKEAKAKNPSVVFVGHVCGVEGDFQGLPGSEAALREAGVILLPTNAQASRVAVQIINRNLPVLPTSSAASAALIANPAGTSKLFEQIGVINLGLQSFTEPVSGHGGKVVQLDWKPPAKGNREIGLKLASMIADTTIQDATEKANQEAVTRLKAGAPVLVDVQPAGDIIPGFKGKKIAHAGPPVTYDNMCGPMKGAVLGAIVYEGWAPNLETAEKVARNEIEYQPCHHFDAVGPMTGILSPSFPVLVVENSAYGNRAYCSLNEGLGKVLRMGANNEQVLDRLRWIQNSLGPTLAAALKVSGPIDLKFILQQAIMMGDECHNRNAAATSLFVRLIAPSFVGLPGAKEALEFMKGNDHFFLNMSMASCKSMLQAASGIKGSTICTVMARNGVEFGVRLSGSGSKWFTAPAPIINGLYFPGYSEADANPDIGDSSITETFGIGGFAMAAAPAIVKFVGGDASDALQKTKEMYRVTSTRHSQFTIPNMDFEGIPLGLDARKVVDTLINPVINTGIAHKVAGIGQVGAGISLAPLEPFMAGIEAVWADLHKE